MFSEAVLKFRGILFASGKAAIKADAITHIARIWVIWPNAGRLLQPVETR